MADFFNTIDHDLLVEFLRIKIQDPVFMRYIVRMLKAGVLSKGEFFVSEEGVPQGKICSPVLSGVFAHYVIDEWFGDVVPKYCRGQVKIFRYADDIVICCEYEEDAIKVKAAFAKRLAKYQLKLNEEKTKMISFIKRKYAAGKQQGNFDFLGFTFYLFKTRTNVIIPNLKKRRNRSEQS